jgi:hypothetical protein
LLKATSRWVSAERLAVWLLVVVVVAQALMLVRLGSRMKPGSGMVSAAEVSPSPFQAGEALLGATVSDGSGSRSQISDLWKSDESVVLLYLAKSDRFTRDLAELHDYAEVYGEGQVVVIECSGDGERHQPYSDQLVGEYALVGTYPLANKLKHFPQVLTVNRCGLITGAYKAVSGLPKAVRGASAERKGS